MREENEFEVEKTEKRNRKGSTQSSQIHNR
jgi:hypothetical protein